MRDTDVRLRDGTYSRFLRNPAQVDYFRDTLLPRLRERPSIDIWCAGCSTGQEVYSLAFLLLDELGTDAGTLVRILASDRSLGLLKIASKAVYEPEQLADLPAAWIENYFRPTGPQILHAAQVIDEARCLVRFCVMDLEQPLPLARAFPIIVCSNVLIYKALPMQQQILDRLVSHLEPDGHLLIGYFEKLYGLHRPYVQVAPTVYEYRPTSMARAGL